MEWNRWLPYPLSSTEFVEPTRKKFLGTPLFSRLFLVWCKMFSWVVSRFPCYCEEKIVAQLPTRVRHILRRCRCCCNGMSYDWESTRIIIWMWTASHCFIWINTDTGPGCWSPTLSAGQVLFTVNHYPLCTLQATVTGSPSLSDHLTCKVLQFSRGYSILKLHIPLGFRIFS
jgi:hypothetical protein